MKSKNLSTVMGIITLGMLVNIGTAAILLESGLMGGSSYRTDEFIKELSNPAWRIIVISGGILSITGILLMIVLFTQIHEMGNIYTAQSELSEEKEKYKQATEQFVKLQKTSSIV